SRDTRPSSSRPPPAAVATRSTSATTSRCRRRCSRRWWRPGGRGRRTNERNGVRMTPGLAAALADAILALHVGVVAFVVLVTIAIPLGGLRGWRWVRSFALRATHLA